jgi:hypothetical protein
MKRAKVTQINTSDFYGQAADTKYVWTFEVPTLGGKTRTVVRETASLDPAVYCDCPVTRTEYGTPCAKLTDCDCQDGYVIPQDEDPEVVWVDPYDRKGGTIAGMVHDE